MSYSSRLQQLDSFLAETASLWQPQPFKVRRPTWCSDHPELTHALLALDAPSLAYFASDQKALIDFISTHIAQITLIPSLTELPTAPSKQHHLIAPHQSSGIPGRKWQQITSLYHCLEKPAFAITEWCGGKAYLGQLLAREWQQQVITLEQNAQLIESGQVAADKQGVDQTFAMVDVLKDSVSQYLSHHHTIALHACGDLHRELIKQIIRTNAPSFTIIPCCYHLGHHTNYTPFNCSLKLQLSRETLRLAVNETVTAHHNEVQNRNLDMAWKLGFQQLRAALTKSSEYHAFKPVPKAWLKGDFKEYCEKLSEREQLTLPEHVDWQTWENSAHQRQHDVLRLQLLRQCFKRVLELWLIMDMAVYLEQHDYIVSVHTFCKRTITPRNIIIEGKRRLPF
ncbi:MAG: methyltransferase [Mariprofundus sp.]|nr:methyltransferase [Mariprofundus sp.]